jgi:c-di-GMP-binding flagellar brake protein YcgR
VCVRLLALSVVQHRTACDFVDFQESVEQLRPEAEDETGLLVRQKAVLAEVLETARSLAAEGISKPGQTLDDATAENRQQLRINIKAPIKVQWPGDPDPVSARLKNISWGGAAVKIPQLRGGTGATLRIILPSVRVGSISIEAKIIRTWDKPDGEGKGFACRFSSLSTRDEVELEKILEVLVQSGDDDGRRKHARLTQRLDIEFADAEELKATLEDISAGGLGITVPEPLEIGQSFQAVISTLDAGCSLKLRARVVRQEPAKMGQLEIYHVGLKFEHPTEDLNERIKELIREMAISRTTSRR